MKKLLILSTLALTQLASAATVTIMNKSNEPLEVSIQYGTSRKSDAIAPNKSTQFNSWLKDINAVEWNNGKTFWRASVNIEALSVGGSFNIYGNGRYDVKNCMTCKQQAATSAKVTRMPGKSVKK